MSRVSYNRVTIGNFPATQDVTSTRTIDISRITQTITRPANTTIYSAGDLLGPSGTFDAFQLANVSASAGQLVILRGVRMVKSSNVVTSSALRLMLFTSKPTSVNGSSDNAGYALSFADSQTIGSANASGGFTALGTTISYVPLVTDERTNSMYTGTGGSLWALWEFTGAFVPASGEQFFFEYLFEVVG